MSKKSRLEVDMSLYPHAYVRARIPLDEELPEVNLPQEYLESLNFRRVSKNFIRGESNLPKFQGRSLFLYHNKRRKEWVAFDVVHIPVDMMSGETYYVGAKALNNFLRAKLSELEV